MNEKCEIELEISFNTPAFLGNAKQQWQWRTPPFKSLLRQWWRVVKSSNGCDLEHIRSDEASLFGSATDDEKKNIRTGKSKLCLKFENWQEGNGTNTINTGTVIHPEVKKKNGNETVSRPVAADLYLGFGPISNSDVKRYISPSETNYLWIAFPKQYESEIVETIQLISWFGTVGSRSRNGWGSINIKSARLNGEALDIQNEVPNSIDKYSDSYRNLMEDDWAKKIGKDSKGLLIWQTKPRKGRYEDVITDLAKIKISYRTAFKFDNGNDKDTDNVSKRYIISYPISNNHSLYKMKDGRNPSQLRFKVVKTQDNKFYGLIFHLPCKVSDKFFTNDKIKEKYKKLESTVWEEIHSLLDRNDNCSRLK